MYDPRREEQADEPVKIMYNKERMSTKNKKPRKTKEIKVDPYELVEKIHLAIYCKSSKPDAFENQNPDFKSGYEIGKEIKDPISTIKKEYLRRKIFEIEDSGFRDWKRGMWATYLVKIIKGGQT